MGKGKEQSLGPKGLTTETGKIAYLSERLSLGLPSQAGQAGETPEAATNALEEIPFKTLTGFGRWLQDHPDPRISLRTLKGNGELEEDEATQIGLEAAQIAPDLFRHFLDSQPSGEEEEPDRSKWDWDR